MSTKKSYGHAMAIMMGSLTRRRLCAFWLCRWCCSKRGGKNWGFTRLNLKFCLRHNPTMTFPVLRQNCRGKSENLFNKEVLAPAHCGKTPRNQPMRPLRMFHLRKLLEVLHGTVGYVSRILKLKNCRTVCHCLP